MTATEQTRHVIQAHVDNVRRWDLAALAENYGPDAVLLVPGAAVRGRDAIMAAFAQSTPVTGIGIDAEMFDAENALISFHSDQFDFATDSFIVRGGQIVFQSSSVSLVAPARSVAQLWADHLEAGRGREAMALLHPAVRYEIIGTTPLSGVYDGAADVMNRLVSSMATFPRTPEVRCEAIIADGNRAAVLGSGAGEAPHGRYDQRRYAWVMIVEDGLIVDLVEYLDTALIETAIFGTRLLRRVEAA